MNITAHQKEKNEETKMSMKKAGERRQSTDFRKAVCYSSAVVQGQHGKKWFEGSAWGSFDPREGQPPFRTNPNGARDRITTLRRLLIGSVQRTW